MTSRFRSSFNLGAVAFPMICIAASLYFVFAAVQGPYGVFRRSEIMSHAQDLRRELAEIEAEVARMQNLTHRMSDAYLDLDLLDQQARDILGLARPDEIVVQ